MKVIARHLDILATLFSGKSTIVCFETAAILHGAEMISEVPSFGDSVRLTPELLTVGGRVQAEARWAFLNRASLKKAAQARATREAYRSLGLVRTRNGGWE